MIYLYWYLGIGGGILTAFYVTRDKGDNSFHEIVESYNPYSNKLSYFIFYNIIIIGLIIMLIIWPVMVAIAAYDRLLWPNEVEQREFAVQCEHLQEQMTVQEIERREVVTDPLRAAPELPFGHLNAAWKTFINDHASIGELWSFTARWQPYRWSKELRSGYVVVRDGVPGPHFLTVRKDVTDETADDDSAS